MARQKDESLEAGARAYCPGDTWPQRTHRLAMLSLSVLLMLLAGMGTLALFAARGQRAPSATIVAVGLPDPPGTPIYSRWGYERILDRHHRAGLQALDHKVDAARGRLWILGWQSMYLYDMTSTRRLREVPLPPGLLQRGGCTPNFTLDREGRAVVASNAAPVLLRIDAARAFVETVRVTPADSRTAERAGLAQNGGPAPSLELALGLAAVPLCARWRFIRPVAIRRHAMAFRQQPAPCRKDRAGGTDQRTVPLQVTGSRDMLADPPYQLCAANDYMSARIGVAVDRVQGRVRAEPCAY